MKELCTFKMLDLWLLGNEMLQKQLCIFDVRLYCLQVLAELINSFSLEGKTWGLAQFSALSGSSENSDFFFCRGGTCMLKEALQVSMQNKIQQVTSDSGLHLNFLIYSHSFDFSQV